jgi:hypothetical protein
VKEKLKLTPEQEKILEQEKKTKRCQVKARYAKKADVNISNSGT